MPRKSTRAPEHELTPGELPDVVREFNQRIRDTHDIERLRTKAVEHAKRILERNDSAAVRRRIERQHGELPDVMTVTDAKNCDWKRLRTMAANVLHFESQLAQAMQSSDVASVALWALKLGAAAREMELIDNVMFRDWLTPNAVQKLTGLSLTSIANLVATGEFASNGATGKGRRLINPASVLRWLNERERIVPREEAEFVSPADES